MLQEDTKHTLEKKRGGKRKQEKEKEKCITELKEITTPSKQWPLYKPNTTPEKIFKGL